MDRIDLAAAGRRDSLERYFWTPPELPKLTPPVLIALAIGILLVIFLMTEALGSIAGFLFGLLAVPLGTGFAMAVLFPEEANRLLRAGLAPKDQPSDEEVDRWTRESIDESVVRSRNLAGLNAGEIIASPGVNVALVLGGEEGRLRSGARERPGRDGTLRSPRLELMVFWVTPRRIVTYECLLDLIESRAQGERFEEFSPADVASVAVVGPRPIAGFDTARPSAPEVLLEVKLRDGAALRLKLDPGLLEKAAAEAGAILNLLRLAVLRPASPAAK